MADQLKYTFVVRLERDSKCFGNGVERLLTLVDQTHSLRQATMQMGMAYSKAWSMIKSCESQLGFDLIIAKTGGKGGGGAELTPKAVKIIADYRNFKVEAMKAIDPLFKEYFGEYD